MERAITQQEKELEKLKKPEESTDEMPIVLKMMPIIGIVVFLIMFAFLILNGVWG